MTTLPFTPNPNTVPPFSAVVTLDGNPYTLAVTWNVYRQDWYITLSDQSGNILVTQPLIGSPPDSNIYLAWGILQSSTLVYRVSSGNFEVTP